MKIKPAYKKSMQEYESWLRSPEGIHDRLEAYDDDGVFHRYIVDTIARLPDDVREFSVDRCCFISIGSGCHGVVFPGKIGVHSTEKRTRNRWIIILSENTSEGDIHSVVAHEIAHAWLGHDLLRMKHHTTEGYEVAARQLTRKWGFTGSGADVELAEKRTQEVERINRSLASQPEPEKA